MAPSPAREESHGGIRSTHGVGRIVRLISALAFVLFASLGATQATATPQDPPLGPGCHGVQVAPGDDLQRLIDRHHRRSTFCFASGVYQLSGTVWTGSKFPRLDLRAGAVIDGQNGAFVRFQWCRFAPGPAGNRSSWAASSSTSVTRARRAGCRRSSSIATASSKGPSSGTTSTRD